MNEVINKNNKIQIHIINRSQGGILFDDINFKILQFRLELEI